MQENSPENPVSDNGTHQFKEVVDQMQVGLFIYHLTNAEDDQSLQMVYANTAALHMVNSDEGQLLGNTICECFPELRETDLPATYAKLAREGGTRNLGDVDYADERVKYAWYSVRAFGMSDNHVGVLFENISTQKTAELQLRHAQKMEAIGQLAAGIAHEINTPIQFVGDNLQFFKDSVCDLFQLLNEYHALFNDPERFKAAFENKEVIENIQDEADLDYLSLEIPKAVGQSLDGVGRVNAIVRAMKEFSHQQDDGWSSCDLNKAIQSTLTISRNEWKYVSTVHTEFDDALPLVTCNHGSINQVLLNLVINAAHAIEDANGLDQKKQGLITITTGHDERNVTISIKDTGNGIPEHVRDRIFEPFFTTKDVGKGTGQGLALAYETIVKRHNGSLTFETAEGEGTTFFLSLPIHQVG